MACSDLNIAQSPFNLAASTYSTVNGVAEAERGAVTFVGPGGVSRRGDFLNLHIPPDATYSAANQPLKDCGLFNPAGAPWSVNVAGGGTPATNVTQLADCWKMCYRFGMVCYLPPSADILINNTVSHIQGLYTRTTGTTIQDQHHPMVVHGSRAAGAIPQIRLANSTSGFTSAGTPKSIVHLWCRDLDAVTQAALSAFNNRLDYFKIVSGTNAGAICLEFNGAQGCSVSYLELDAIGGYCCAKIGLGSGAQMIGITCTGGQIGAWTPAVNGFFDGCRPCPLYVGWTFDHQTLRCVDFSGAAESPTFVACHFKMAPALTMVLLRGGNATTKEVSFVDCIFEFDSYNAANVCVDGDGCCYMQNCFARFADRIFKGNVDLAGNTGGWMHIREYSHGRLPPTKSVCEPGGVNCTTTQFEQGNWVDGVNLGYTDVVDTVNGVAPPADLQSRHLPPIEHFEDPDAVSVRDAPYNLIGNGAPEDLLGAVTAIHALGKKPFLPRGAWGIDVVNDWPANVIVIGVDPSLSVIMPRDDIGGDFENGQGPNPGIRTFNSVYDQTRLCNIGIFVGWGEDGLYGLNWRSGRRSSAFPFHLHRFPSRGNNASNTSFRGQNITGVGSDRPCVLWSDGAGGRFYGFELGENFHTTKEYRCFKAEGTSEPLAYYNLNPEHATASESQIEVDRCRDVTLYALKSEGNDTGAGSLDTPPIWVRNSDRFNVYSGGGAGAAAPNTQNYPAGWAQRVPSVLRFDRVPNFRATAYQVRGKKAGTPQATPANTHFLLDRPGQALTSEILTNPLEYPSLYRRGYSAPWREAPYPMMAWNNNRAQMHTFVLNTVTGSQRVTKAWGQGNVPAVIEFYGGVAGPGGDAMFFEGACVPQGSPFRQCSMCARSQDNVKTSNSDAGIRSDAAILISSGNATEVARAVVSVIDDEGFTLDVVVTPTGTATSGGATTLTDTAKLFAVDAHAGKDLKIVAGTGNGEVRGIVSNTATVITVDAAWTTNPDATSQYQIVENLRIMVVARFGILADCGTVQVAGTAPFTQDITSLSFEPKGYKIISSKVGLVNGVEAQSRYTMGWTDGVNQGCAGWLSLDALATTSDCQGFQVATDVYARITGGLTYVDRIQHSAFLPNGFRLNASLLSATRVLMWIAYGGPALTVEVGSLLQPTSSSSQAMPGTANPTSIDFISQAKASSTSVTNNSRGMLGVAVPSEQFSSALTETNGISMAAGNECASDFDLERAIIFVDGAAPARLATGWLDAGLNNITWTVNEATQREVLYMKIFARDPAGSALQASANVAPALTAQIRCASALQASANVAPALTAQIRCASALQASANVAPALTAQIRCASALQASANVAPALTAQIRCASALQASANVAAPLTTDLRCASALATSASIAADLRGVAAVLNAAPQASANITPVLTTSIRMMGTVDCLATVAPALTTQIRFASAPQATANVAAPLTTQVRFASVLATSANLAAALQAGAGVMDAALQATANVAAPLTTQVRFASVLATSANLAAALQAGAVCASALATSVTIAADLRGVAAVLNAAPQASANITPVLTTSIGMMGTVDCLATFAPALTTQILFASAPQTSANVAPALTTQIRCASAPQASANITPVLTTSIRMMGTVDCLATVAPALTTQIRFASAPQATANVAAPLTTQVRFASVLATSANLAAALQAGAGVMDAALQAAANVAPALTTSIRMMGTVDCLATVAPALTTQIRIASALAAEVNLSAGLIVPITPRPSGIARVTVARSTHLSN